MLETIQQRVERASRDELRRSRRRKRPGRESGFSIKPDWAPCNLCGTLFEVTSVAGRLFRREDGVLGWCCDRCRELQALFSNRN